MKEKRNGKTLTQLAVRCSALLGAFQCMSLSDFGVFLRLLLKQVAHFFLIALVKMRYGSLCRLTELRMVLIKAREICLKRGYLTGNEPNLRTNRVLWRAAIHHPVKIVDVFLESFHFVMRHVAPNARAHRPPSPDLSKFQNSTAWSQAQNGGSVQRFCYPLRFHLTDNTTIRTKTVNVAIFRGAQSQ